MWVLAVGVRAGRPRRALCFCESDGFFSSKGWMSAGSVPAGMMWRRLCRWVEFAAAWAIPPTCGTSRWRGRRMCGSGACCRTKRLRRRREKCPPQPPDQRKRSFLAECKQRRPSRSPPSCAGDRISFIFSFWSKGFFLILFLEVFSDERRNV